MLNVELVHVFDLVESLFRFFVAFADVRFDQQHHFFVRFLVDIMNLFAPQLYLLVNRNVFCRGEKLWFRFL